MASKPERATLKAVLFADLAQYTRLVARNEPDTLTFVDRCFDLFRQHCEDFDGDFVKTTGDGVLILFDSASSAVDYAMTIQAKLHALAEDRGKVAHFRIGLHMGEVRRRAGDVYGHAVNLAARVEQQAQAGGVCVTQDVYWASRNSTQNRFRFAGRTALKNIPDPIALYHVVRHEGADEAEIDRCYDISVIDGLMIRFEVDEPVQLRSRRVQGLIGYLALSADYQDAENRIAALFWPDRNLADARRALGRCMRTAASSLALDAQRVLRQHAGLIGLNSDAVSVDIVRLFQNLRDGEVDELLLRRPDWPDAILLGFESLSPLFNVWLTVTRHRWHDRVLKSLEASLERFEVGEPAIAYTASAILNLDATHERAAQYLIRHHIATRNPAAAIRVFRQLGDILRDRFQIDPSAETRKLVESVSAPLPDKAPLHPRRQDARAPRIAVGDFPDPEQLDIHASGFRSELIANLSRFREWAVIELQPSVTISDAEYLLSTECTTTDGDVQIFVALSEVGTRRIVWSEKFALSLHQWVEVQKRVVDRIASTLEIYISQDRLSRTLQQSSSDLDAYDAWLRGEHLLTSWSPQAEDEAEALFERVIAEDPHFAPAYASLASIYNSRNFIRPGIVADPERHAHALDLGRRAVKLDPFNARNHLVVAWSTAITRRFEQSELAYGLAVELNPNSPTTLISASLGLAFAGSNDLARQMLERARALTTIFLDYQWSHIATISYLLGDFSGAVKAANYSNDLIIDTPGWRAAALLKLGRAEEARIALMQLQTKVATRWVGPNAATRDSILDWFLSAFPIKQGEIYADLSELRHLADGPG